MITLPRDIQTTLAIKEGERVLLKIEPDSKVILEKALIISAKGEFFSV